MRKILFVITKSNFGGAQRYVYDLAVNLPRDQFEVAVAVGGQGPLIGKLLEARIRVIIIPSLERDISLKKELLAGNELWKIIKAERPDILHINSSKAGALGALIGRLARVPRIIFTAHGWAFNEDRPRWQQLVLKLIHWVTVLLTHESIAVSHEVKRQMKWPWAGQKLTVIHNGLPPIQFYNRQEARGLLAAIEPRLNEHQNDFWSITIAELHPVKRHDAVIRSMTEIIKVSPNSRHIIIGDGEEKDRLSSLIKELNLTDHVFLLGRVDDASRFLKATNLFILASRSEGLPYVVTEAAMAALPIIASDVGGIPEIIEHQKEGVLVPPYDEKALFSAILWLTNDQRERELLAAGAKQKSQVFSLANNLQQTTELYHLHQPD